MKVLIVDNEAFLAELVKLALEADGHDSFVVAGVQAASELLRTVGIEMVLIDLNAAGRKPMAWLEETILAYPDLHGRIFVLTGRPLTADEAASIIACGAQVIDKPVSLQQMRDTVQAIAPVAGRTAEPRARRPAIEA